MTQAPRNAFPVLIPESAPFTPEQRAWLNGFFSGMVSPDSAGVTALSPEESAALMATTQPASPLDDGDDGDAPWHDQTLPLADRMALAEGRPLRRRMMAAMAQQDCGQCGYTCEDYSNALALGSEQRLNLCVPGGKETARMLKTLAAELTSTAGSVRPAANGIGSPAVVRDGGIIAPPADSEPPAAPRGRSRDNPAEALFLSRTRLNKAGSAKETWHIEIDLSGAEGLDYTVGDSLGIYPRNEPALVDAVMRAIAADPQASVGGRPLRDVLTGETSLSPAPDSLFQLISYLTGGERRQKAKALAAGEDPDGDAASLDVLAALQKFHGLRPDPEAFLEALEPLQPRLYSIASSPRSNPGRVALTVDTVRYAIGNRPRLGVASTFLADRIAPGDRLKIYIQQAHGFGLPADPATPIVMIGPGTGVAPFRAFLHERMATRAPGPNWLFFGHQRRDHDFFYEDEFAAMKAKGVLTRLSLAWSRDGDQKFYVQDRMREVGRDLWAWLADGAYVYVCGDAKRMAKDVERALVDIVAQFGARSTDQAIAFVADLKKKGRYRQDVY
ncbi:MAG TPA: sulfite reductase subunit alpha [Xanthobacteraceae bacterium]|nr:sulfite reductase subunit alpha [Xanthobacteraceae bacterium]